MRQCSIIVPVFGNGGQLRELAQRTDAAFSSLPAWSVEIVFVDDCGPGDAWNEISSIANQRQQTVGIRLMRNFGQHNALMCGFQHAIGEIVVTLDDDLQHPPESVPEMIRAMEESDADLVYGVYDSKQHPASRNLGSWLITRFYQLIFRIPVTATSMRAIRKELVQAILRYDLNFTYIDGLLAWNTQRIKMLTVPHHPRADGKSGYTIGKLITLAMNVFTNFSLLPLQFVSLLGIAAALAGFALGSWYVISAFRAQIQVPGYASTIVAVLVLGGTQLLSLGIIGEYIGRLHLNVNRKPQYTIRNTAMNRVQEEG